MGKFLFGLLCLLPLGVLAQTLDGGGVYWNGQGGGTSVDPSELAADVVDNGDGTCDLIAQDSTILTTQPFNCASDTFYQYQVVDVDPADSLCQLQQSLNGGAFATVGSFPCGAGGTSLPIATPTQYLNCDPTNNTAAMTPLATEQYVNQGHSFTSIPITGVSNTCDIGVTNATGVTVAERVQWVNVRASDNVSVADPQGTTSDNITVDSSVNVALIKDNATDFHDRSHVSSSLNVTLSDSEQSLVAASENITIESLDDAAILAARDVTTDPSATAGIVGLDRTLVGGVDNIQINISAANAALVGLSNSTITRASNSVISGANHDIENARTSGIFGNGHQIPVTAPGQTIGDSPFGMLIAGAGHQVDTTNTIYTLDPDNFTILGINNKLNPDRSSTNGFILHGTLNYVGTGAASQATQSLQSSVIDGRLSGSDGPSTLIDARSAANGLVNGSFDYGWTVGSAANVASPYSSANRSGVMRASTGDLYISGSVTTGYSFPDYAEVFENETVGVIEPGYPIAIGVGGVRIAREGDYVIGVVSKSYGVLLGDGPATDEEKYIMTEWGERVYHEDSIHAYGATDQEKEEGLAGQKEDRFAKMQQPVKINPNWQPHPEGLTKSQVPEKYTVVGLVGQPFARVAEDVSPGDFLKPNKDGILEYSKDQTHLIAYKERQAYDRILGFGIMQVVVK